MSRPILLPESQDSFDSHDGSDQHERHRPLEKRRRRRSMQSTLDGSSTDSGSTDGSRHGSRHGRRKSGSRTGSSEHQRHDKKHRKIKHKIKRLRRKFGDLSQSSLLVLDRLFRDIGEEERDTLAYKFFNQEQMQVIMKDSPKAMTETLAEILELRDYKVNLQQAAILDYYVGGLAWARDSQNFTEQQVSAVATLLHLMFVNVSDKSMTLPLCIQEFKKFFIGLGIDKAESSMETSSCMLEMFDIPQAKIIMNFFAQTIFMHFKLYSFVFNDQQTHEVVVCEQNVELPMGSYKVWPPPLHEGVAESFYTEVISPPPVTPATTAKQEEDVPAPTEVDEEARLAELLTQLSVEDIRGAFREILGDEVDVVKNEALAKVRQKENDFIQRINKLHVVEKPSTPASRKSTPDKTGRKK